MKYDVDCILVAVGLSEVNEFVKKAQTFGITTYSAGDSQEVAEASAAMLTGRSQASPYRLQPASLHPPPYEVVADEVSGDDVLGAGCQYDFFCCFPFFHQTWIFAFGGNV